MSEQPSSKIEAVADKELQDAAGGQAEGAPAGSISTSGPENDTGQTACLD